MVLNGFYSDYSIIETGVPQGSILGPLLFLIYINDLEWNIISNIKFFADNTMLFSIVKDPVISANDINHDLDMIYQWAHLWKMEFNPDPSKQATDVLFSTNIQWNWCSVWKWTKTFRSYPRAGLIFWETYQRKDH